MQKNESAMNAKEIVISFLESLNDRDFKSARSYVSDDFSFTSPPGSADSAETYFKGVEQQQLKFDIKKIFTDGNDVCVFNDVIAGPITLLASGWYHVEDQKMRSLKLVYDPRPLLQKRQ
ncbi:MAG: nuclear transport factor 2 family protein [Nitrososphaera sp.]|uniref:nuclear transport factor 2 family protein n=1 Tax=Nitrososphaera sp. TaxID=1971748 RepID=UPI003D6FB41D